jgi:hypothetical protein
MDAYPGIMTRIESVGMDRARFLAGGPAPTVRVAAAVAAVVTIAGCVTDVAPPRQTIWETSLTAGPEHPDMTGSAAAVSVGTSTQASVSVQGLGAGTYRWGVFRGECAATGDVLASDAAYPTLSVGLEGAATADATVPRPMLSDRSYYAQVRTADNVPVACGDFVPWQ